MLCARQNDFEYKEIWYSQFLTTDLIVLNTAFERISFLNHYTLSNAASVTLSDVEAPLAEKIFPLESQIPISDW